uniref:Uncharacterized protein n=1 Tax=Trichogramma kaykai TaxID=54128 RepID=A0ABD2WGL5_9HYME
MPTTRSLEESASPQARASEISDLHRPPVHRLPTAARVCLGHGGIACAGDDVYEARRHILRGPGSDRGAGHDGRETVRIECTGVPPAALARRGPGRSPGVLDLEDDGLVVAVCVDDRATLLAVESWHYAGVKQHRVEESERVKQDGRPWSSHPTSPLHRPCVEVPFNNEGPLAAGFLGDVRKEGGKFYLRESWWNVDAEKENSANSGPREVGMNSCRALLDRDFSLHPDSCLAVGIGEPCVGWSEVLVLLTQDGHVDA